MVRIISAADLRLQLENAQGRTVRGGFHHKLLDLEVIDEIKKSYTWTTSEVDTEPFRICKRCRHACWIVVKGSDKHLLLNVILTEHPSLGTIISIGAPY